jgi:hypothetical protein
VFFRFGSLQSRFVLAGSSPKLGTEYQVLSTDFGGADRDRTGDLLLAKQALSQLSYSPARSCQFSANQVFPDDCQLPTDKWWAWLESN